MKAAVVDTGRAGRLRVELKTPRAPPPALDCPDQLQLYLNRLTALVPTAPKHRRLTKLEVIQCVIDYICDLEDTLLSRQLPGDEPAAAGELRARPGDQHSASSADQHSTSSADQHSASSADQHSTSSADQHSTLRTNQVASTADLLFASAQQQPVPGPRRDAPL